MNGTTQTISDPNGTPSYSGQPILFYYRLEDANNISTFNSANMNTIWINANSISNQISNGNYYVSNTVLLGGKNASITNTYSGNTLTVNASIPSFSVGSNDVKYIYLRVGLPMGYDIGFKYVSMNLII